MSINEERRNKNKEEVLILNACDYSIQIVDNIVGLKVVVAVPPG